MERIKRVRPVNYKRWLKIPELEIPRTTLLSRNKRIRLNDANIDEGSSTGGVNMNECFQLVRNGDYDVNDLLECSSNEFPELMINDESNVADINSSECHNRSHESLIFDDSGADLRDCGDDRSSMHEKSQRKFLNGSPIFAEEAEILIMAYIIRYNLNDEAVDGLIQLFTTLVPECTLPRTIYSFMKKFDSRKDVSALKRHFCSACSMIISCGSDKRGAMCSKCSRECNSDFFYYFPIKDALTQFVNSSDYLIMINRHEYSDVNDGEYCKNNQNISKTDVTLQLNTDGVSIFDSSNKSLWPIQVLINNLPLLLRRKYLLLCGLWFGKNKPDMNMYLRLFVEEMKQLYDDGIVREVDNTLVKVHVVLCVCDSVARPTLQNIKQFNGEYGCSFCLQEGEISKRSTRIYPKMSILPIRNLEQHMADARKSIEGRPTPINGVKGPSVLMLLPSFDITKCFSIDYMHSALLGVVKQFIEQWFDSANHDQPWYLGTKESDFDKKLLSIRPPCEISWLPRPISTRKKWKASELRNFLLYYSFYCISDLLPTRFVSHWCALIYSISTFLQPSITTEEWRKATEALFHFVINIGNLYNKNFYKFNVHLLLHLPICVREFGALWATSCFPFEHYNGILNKLFVNATGVQQQICKNYFRFKKLMLESNKFYDSSAFLDQVPLGKQLFINFMNGDKDENLQLTGDVYQFSVRKTRATISISEQRSIEAVLDSKIDINAVTLYQFCNVRGMLLHSYDFNKLKSRNNSIVQLQDATVIMVCKILKVFITSPIEINEKRIVIEAIPATKRINNSNLPKQNKFIASVTKELVFNCTRQRIFVLPEMIQKKCVSINVIGDDDGINYTLATPLANHLENGW
ncbi:uncharacterized protein LOC135846716 [Planococcus citri]|uniref:uncharacterized protein LOC135846716 n=1 Tax=Planococcus citri TaxID=170843 RepID=UPI0031F89AFC